MSEYLDGVKNAVERLHGCSAKHLGTTPVKEVFQGKTVWDGAVEIFTLGGHPKAKRAYAWGFKEGEKDMRYLAVLELPPVKSPQDAVRAAIASGSKV